MLNLSSATVLFTLAAVLARNSNSFAYGFSSFYPATKSFAPMGGARSEPHLLLASVSTEAALVIDAESQFNVQDLMPGDIIAWETEQDPISELVAILSGDPYGHAAIVYDKKHLVIEQSGSGGCRVWDFLNDKTRKDRISTVTRLEGIDTASVLKAGEHYLDVPYSNGGLAFMAVLLILNNPMILIKESKAIIEGVNSFLKMIGSEFQIPTIKSQVKATEPPKDPMFCSQYVYQVYADAGIPLEICDPVTPRSSADQPQTLNEYVMEEVSAMDDLSEEDFETKEAMTMDMAAKNLCQALEEDLKADTVCNNNKVAPQITGALKRELVSSVIKFALAYGKGRIPENITSLKEKVMWVLRSLRNKNVVTPGELTRIANGKLMGSFIVPKAE